MTPEDQTNTVLNQVKVSSFFVVAALSPSFLISLLCVFAYLVTQFPEIKEPVSNVISNLLARAGVKPNQQDTTTGNK